MFIIPREELETVQRVNRKRRRIIWVSIGGAVLIAIIFIILSVFTDVIGGPTEGYSSVTPEGQWTMFRRDLQHTGNLDGTEPGTSGDVAWVFKTDGPVQSSPAVVDGVVYFGSRDSHIYALDVETGIEIWKYKTGSWVDASPIVYDGVVYCGSNDGNMYALDAKTGAKLWNYDATYPLRGAPAIAGDSLYFGGEDWHVTAVELATGKLKWKVGTGNLVQSSPCVVDGIVVIGGTDRILYGIHADSGSKRLEYKIGSMITGSPLADEGVTFIAATDGLLHAVNPQARNWFGENVLKPYWDALYLRGAAPRPPVRSGYLWHVSLGWNIEAVSSPALADNTFYLGAGPALYAIDKESRSVTWSVPAGDLVTSSPAIGERAVYYGSYDGNLYAVERQTGDIIWQFETGGRVTSSPALAYGKVFFGSLDGYLYALK